MKSNLFKAGHFLVNNRELNLCSVKSEMSAESESSSGSEMSAEDKDKIQRKLTKTYELIAEACRRR